MREGSGWEGDLEETQGVGVHGVFEIGVGDVAEVGEEAGDIGDEAGFVGADFAMRLRREEGGIGFDHHAIERNELGGFGDGFGVGESDDACEGNGCAEIEDEAGVGRVACEAVKDKAVRGEDCIGVFAEGGKDGDEFGIGIAAVDDNGFFERDVDAGSGFDEGELMVEDVALGFCRRVGVVVVEAELAPGDAL